MFYGSLEILLVLKQTLFFIHVIVYEPIIKYKKYFRISVLLNKIYLCI